jgi:hypothetical protein
MIRKYVTVFGSLFADIYVNRKNAAGVLQQSIGVPIAYGPKEKWLSRITQDPSLNRTINIVLPRMGFEIMQLTYAATRALPATQKNYKSIGSNDNSLKSQYVPVPYDIDFVLSIFTRNADDGAQIIEQILPYFRPEWNVTIDPVDGMDMKMDIPVILTGMNTEDVYEGDFEMRRSLIWNLNFTMKAWLYGPVRTSGIIKRVQVDSVLVPGQDPIESTDVGVYSRQDRVVVQPGLNANGEATTDIDDSVPYTSINVEDPYGFATDINLFTDGKQYDPESGADV